MELHLRLDALGEAVTTRIRHLEQDGLLDSDTRLAATYFHLRHISIALKLDATTLKGQPARPKSVIADEIARLAQALNLWVMRVDRKFAHGACALRGLDHRDPA